jgi:hypothetical protein
MLDVNEITSETLEAAEMLLLRTVSECRMSDHKRNEYIEELEVQISLQ